uniref:mucin-2-like n=1 Tax=Pristiophorus japonicus TaxID=55135 RepID=UPI00398F2556
MYFLKITLDTKYKNQTCGLCGNFQEGTGINSDSNDALYNIMVANQLDILGHVCVNDQPTHSTCSAAASCILPLSLYFSTCFENPTFFSKYLKLCQRDVCAGGNRKECACATFEELSRLCTSLPEISDNEDYFFGVSWTEWRLRTSCESPDCPENQFYQECGAMCVPTCSDPETQHQCDPCMNACECPKDTVLDDIRGTDRCISKTACPCEYSGKIYEPGEIRNTSCHSCVCQSGMWECSEISCPGRCKIEEGTYFTTFDNKYYTLKGDCSYYAVVTPAWTVTIEVLPCQIAFKQTCLQRVVFTNNQTWYAFTNDGNVYSEGDKVGLPLERGNIIIFQQSSMFLQVATDSGLKMQVQISPIMQLYISLPEDAQESTKGLCGTFNDNANDDFLSAYNIVEDAPLNFVNSWAVENNCPETTILVPCVSSENEHYAKQHCSYLKDPTGAFSVCHSTVDYMKYYQMCVAATCGCENIEDCLCAGLGAYVHACAANGVIVRNWRRDICNKSCSSSQVFENDMRACNRTCRSLSEYDYTCEVQDVAVYGCGCPEGKYMDETGVCVDRSDCSCYTEGRLIEKGQSIPVNGRHCICQDGTFQCVEVRAEPWPPVCHDGKIFINCANEAVSSSEYLCAKMCRTLNTPCQSACVSDCVCPRGLVEDDNGNCIAREDCPCLFGGEIYTEGRIIQRDCNKCTCQEGSWNCTNKSCPKTCEVYGDGHYITFDGKRYVYDGNCEYIFVEDQCNRREGTLQILTESVPCCERGMTCSRNIRILLKGKELILTDNKVSIVEKSTNQTQCTDNSYSLHTVGLYLILTFSNGITVIWDKSTRLSITLDPRWKNKVCGLCGNFNDDISDDLTTKGNSLVTSTVEFGNSWKSMTCSDTVNQTSPCERNPYCFAWAQRKCGIIKHVVFQSCHKKVDPSPYYDACVQEACACDMEGKYLGFCTAVAVYAEVCNKAGVCIDWRTPERCPVYCDYYNAPGDCSWHYHPCGTLTTKTCSEHYIGKKYSAVLEGCYAKCPESAPYLDENKMKCVNLSECTCYYNGKILETNEQSNDCRNCVCIDGNMNCTELPFTTTKMSTVRSPPTSTSTLEIPFTTTKMSTVRSPPTSTSTLDWHCDSQWSLWFNENTPTLQNRADTELLNQMQSPLCPFSPYQISAIQCEALKFPHRPISETKDNVTCDKETGLVCTYNPQTSEGGLTCLDYRIRVCCQRTLTNHTTQTTIMTTSTTVQTAPSTISRTIQIVPISASTTGQIAASTTDQTAPSTTNSTIQIAHSTTVQTTPSTTVQPAPSTTVQPAPSITVQPAPSTTVQPAPSTTVQPAPSTIVQPAPSTTVQPAPSTTIQPAPSTTVQPAPSTTVQPAPSTTIQPAPSTTVQPAPSTIVQTAPSTTVQPAPSTTVQPAPSTTVQPAPSTTVQTAPSTTVQPAPSTTVQPAPSTTVQPAPSTTVQPAPSTTVQPAPSTTVQPAPSTTVQPAPSTTVQTAPSTTVQPAPSTTVQTTPSSTSSTIQIVPISASTTGQRAPSTIVQMAPSTIVQPAPNTTVQPAPSTTVQPTPSTTIQPAPITIVQTAPSTTVQPAPSTTVQPAPSTTVQPAPSTTVQPAPSTTIQPAPSTTVQPAPNTIVQMAPSTIVQPAPNTIVQPAPSTTVQPAPSTTAQTTIPCLPDPKPTCQRSSRVRGENGCEKWDCFCQCQIWGDPHYLTFGGTQYDFFENCTYILVEERVPKYNFTILVDNYFCLAGIPFSCARGIIIFYNGSVVTITTVPNPQINFDGAVVTVPYSSNGIYIRSTYQNIDLSIPNIQANIIAFGDSFRIKLSQKYFLNNTQGQCGMCNLRLRSFYIIKD